MVFAVWARRPAREAAPRPSIRATRHKRRLAGRALARLALRGIQFLHRKSGAELKRREREARAEQDGKAATEELKGKVPCAAVLEHLGFALDVKESTRKGDP